MRYPVHEQESWNTPWPGSAPMLDYTRETIIIPYVHDLTARKIYYNDAGVWRTEPDWSELFSLNLIKYKKLEQVMNADRRLARDRGVGLD